MIISDSITQDRAKDLSGVNLLFLAPEYFNGDDHDWKVDCWSIGVILYLLITNGVVQANVNGSYEEHFNFMEPIWPAIDEYVANFIKSMLQCDPVDRASVDELFESEFIRRHENRMLDNWIISK